MEHKNSDTGGVAVIEHDPKLKPKKKVKKPRKWKVLILNDDFTPMDFVVGILLRYFGKSDEEAFTVMKTVHEKGIGLAGVYTFEVAESKVGQVSDVARMNNFPLRLTVEPEDPEDE